jgi:hypothetical protein
MDVHLRGGGLQPGPHTQSAGSDRRTTAIGPSNSPTTANQAPRPLSPTAIPRLLIPKSPLPKPSSTAC